MSEIIQFLEAHKALDTALAAWFTREIPLMWSYLKNTVWPALVAIYPYCRDNGGVCGIIKTFFCGKQQTKITP